MHPGEKDRQTLVPGFRRDAYSEITLKLYMSNGVSPKGATYVPMEQNRHMGYDTFRFILYLDTAIGICPIGE